MFEIWQNICEALIKKIFCLKAIENGIQRKLWLHKSLTRKTSFIYEKNNQINDFANFSFVRFFVRYENSCREVNFNHFKP